MCWTGIKILRVLEYSYEVLYITVPGAPLPINWTFDPTRAMAWYQEHVSPHLTIVFASIQIEGSIQVRAYSGSYERNNQVSLVTLRVRAAATTTWKSTLNIDQIDLLYISRTTVHTFNDGPFSHLSFGYTADACGSLIIHILDIKVKDCTEASRSEETYPRLYTAEAA